MSHKASDAETLSELELVETEWHSEEKYKKIHKDVLGLQTESDLVLSRHIPDILNKLDRLTGDIIIIRDDHADTNRLVRKMYYELIPSLHTKIDNLDKKLDEKFSLLCSKLDELLKK